MGWEMNAINGHTSKLHKYTVLDTVLKLENKKVKKKNTWLLKRFRCFGLHYTIFRLVTAYN